MTMTMIIYYDHGHDYDHDLVAGVENGYVLYELDWVLQHHADQWHPPKLLEGMAAINVQGLAMKTRHCKCCIS